jgi:hypothetical protein
MGTHSRVWDDGPVSDEQSGTVGTDDTTGIQSPGDLTSPGGPAAPTGPASPAGPAENAGMNHIQSAALSAVLAGALAAGMYLGPVATLIAVAVVQAVLVPSWVLGNRLPGRLGALALGLLAAAGADVATMHWHNSGYSPLLGVLAVAIPLMFAHQLTRGVVRSRVVESLAGITIALVGVVAIAGLIVLRYQADGKTIGLAVVGAFGVGLVVAHLTDAALPSPRFDPSMDRGLPAVVLGIAAGAVVGYLALRDQIDFAGGRAAFVGGALAAVSCLLSIGASFAGNHRSTIAEPDATSEPDPAERFSRLRPAGAVALTIALTIPAAYVLTNALTSS